METPQAETLTPARETHLRDYWKVVWHGRYTVLAVFLLVVVVTAVYTFLQQPVYRSTATIEIQPRTLNLAPGRDVSGMGSASYGWWAEEKYHNTQVEIIRSTDVARRAFLALGLASHPRFADAADPLEAFRAGIQVDPRRETGLIEISMTGTDPEEMTQWANAVADAYVERNLETARDNVAIAVEAIRGQIAPLQEELRTAERNRLDILQRNEIYDPESEEEIARQRLTKYHAALGDVEIEINQLENLLSKTRELRLAGADPMTLPELAQDEVLQDLNHQRVELERQIEIAKVTLRPSHPQYEEKLGELAKVRQKIDGQVDRILAGVDNRYALAQANERDLRQQIRAAEQVSLKVGQATSRIQIANTDSETKKRVFNLITETMNEVQLGAGLLANNVRVLDPAKVPLFAIHPRKKVNLVVGAMFGIFLGFGLVFFLDYLDNTFRTPQDIENYLGLSVLGVIPKFAGPMTESRAQKEAYQSLRTSIIFSSKNRRRKTILVTSTGPQEGKSSAVANLGKTLAGAGDRVIVIDCDLRRPTQHVHLELDRDTGLTNYLAAPQDETDWTVYVKPTDVPNLQAMVCGPIPPSPPELLGSERFRKLLNDLRERYDWVLIDSPPAASLADSSLLASMADMVMLVVRHNLTDRDLVARTVQQIRALNAPLVGALLNNVDLDRAYSKDYYYAGYYYYSEDGVGKTKTKTKTKKGRGEHKVSARAG